MKITENLVTNLKHNVPQQYITKGFPDAKITIEDKINANPNLIDWTINVDKGKRIKIDRIDFEGNNSVSSSKLRKTVLKIRSKRDSFLACLSLLSLLKINTKKTRKLL